MVRHEVKSGKVLLAEPFLIDPNFRRSAVLLCEHGEAGSVGFVMNRRLKVKIHDLIQGFPKFKAPVFQGGPVGQDTIHYFHNVGELLEESHEIIPGVYWGGDFNKLKFLIDQELIQPHNIRFFVGYSGWDEGQLLSELDYGSWVVADMDPNYLFKTNYRQLWTQVMYNKGDVYTVIAQMRDEVNYN
jgi:putative transcriptional regulator